MTNKRGWLIGVAVVAVIVLIYIVVDRFGGTTMSGLPAKPGPETTERANVASSVNTLHQACRYADSVGIDTSRFATSTDTALNHRRLAALLLEIRYGRKPSRVTYSGLRETVDSAWAGQPTAEQMPGRLAKAASLKPYRQLIGHYNQLRSRARNNLAAADSLRLIRQTLNFYRYVNRFDADKFVMVNIPAGELTVFDRSGKRLLPGMQVIAGKPDTRTPCMTTYIKDIVAYPQWNVPRKIALNEMLPRMQRSLAYIYNQNLQILDQKGNEVNPEDIDWDDLSATNFPYRVRQASGCENSLGLLKFNLENPLAIYLHDTNSRDLFTQTSDHWRSHGCVRVQRPVELANLVLGKPTFDAEFMNRCLIDQKPRTLAIPKPVPVFLTYNIADVDENGKLHVYRDVYARQKTE